jgi:hypothetical protein
LLARTEYVNRQIGNGRPLYAYPNLSPINIVEKTSETIKEVMYYLDEYGHTNYYTIIIEPIAFIELGCRHDTKYKSTAFISNEFGVAVDPDIFNTYTIAVFGSNSLLETHYAAIYDLNMKARDSEIEKANEHSMETLRTMDNERTSILSKIYTMPIANSGCECSICLDDPQTPMIKTDCNHSFHSDCLKQWVATSNLKLDNS